MPQLYQVYEDSDHLLTTGSDGVKNVYRYWDNIWTTGGYIGLSMMYINFDYIFMNDLDDTWHSWDYGDPIHANSPYNNFRIYNEQEDPNIFKFYAVITENYFDIKNNELTQIKDKTRICGVLEWSYDVGGDKATKNDDDTYTLDYKGINTEVDFKYTPIREVDRYLITEPVVKSKNGTILEDFPHEFKVKDAVFTYSDYNSRVSTDKSKYYSTSNKEITLTVQGGGSFTFNCNESSEAKQTVDQGSSYDNKGTFNMTLNGNNTYDISNIKGFAKHSQASLDAYFPPLSTKLTPANQPYVKNYKDFLALQQKNGAIYTQNEINDYPTPSWYMGPITNKYWEMYDGYWKGRGARYLEYEGGGVYNLFE